MEQSAIMAFEQGMDAFMLGLKNELIAEHSLHIAHLTVPRCLDCLKVVDVDGSCLQLRLVLVGCSPDVSFGRLSWVTEDGREHICCYLNSNYEAVKRKSNGLWVKQRYSAEDTCLRKWSRLHSLMSS